MSLKLSVLKTPEQTERESVLQLSIWSIQTVLEPQKDKRLAEKYPIHKL